MIQGCDTYDPLMWQLWSQIVLLIWENMPSENENNVREKSLSVSIRRLGQIPVSFCNIPFLYKTPVLFSKIFVLLFKILKTFSRSVYITARSWSYFTKSLYIFARFLYCFGRNLNNITLGQYNITCSFLLLYLIVFWVWPEVCTGLYSGLAHNIP